MLDALTKAVCSGVKRVRPTLSSRKNCDRVIPNASQMRSRDGMEEIRFLRYHEEMVDCVNYTTDLIALAESVFNSKKR